MGTAPVDLSIESNDKWIESRTILQGIVTSAFGKMTISSDDFPGTYSKFSRTYFADRSRTATPVNRQVSEKLITLLDVCLDEGPQKATARSINAIAKEYGDAALPKNRKMAVSRLKADGNYWRWTREDISWRLASYLGELLDQNLELLVIQPDEPAETAYVKQSNLLRLAQMTLSAAEDCDYCDVTTLQHEAADYIASIANAFAGYNDPTNAIVATETIFQLEKKKESALAEVDRLIRGEGFSLTPTGLLVEKAFEAIGIRDFQALSKVLSQGVPGANLIESIGSVLMTANTLNALDVLDRAAKGLSEDDPIKKIDDGWFVKFFNFAGEERNVEVKDLLAEMLKAEAKKHGSISKHLVMTLCMMEEGDRVDFKNLARFCFYDFKESDAVHTMLFMNEGHGSYGNSNISTAMLARLRSFGLIDTDYDRGFGVMDELKIRYARHVLTAVKNADEENRIVPTGNVRLTRDGIALFNLLEEKQTNEAILDFTAKQLTKKGCRVTTKRY